MCLKGHFSGPNQHPQHHHSVKNPQMRGIVLPEDVKKPGVSSPGGKTIPLHVTKSIQSAALCHHSCPRYILPRPRPPLAALPTFPHTPLPLSLSLKSQAPSLCFTRKSQNLPPGGRNNQHQEAEAPHGTRECQDIRDHKNTKLKLCCMV